MKIINEDNELKLEIEDLEERIAPHLSINPAGITGSFDIGTSGGLHGTVGPEADFVRPHH